MDERDELIAQRLEKLKLDPDFHGLDEQALLMSAEELVDQDIAFKHQLSPDEVVAVLETIFKAEQFIKFGKRHINTAIYPEPSVLKMSASKLASAVAFVERHTFWLYRRHIETHQDCRCYPAVIRLRWNKESKQFIYTT